jgi:hypothetical protein
MIWKLLTGGIGSAIEGITNLGSLWMKGKQAKQEAKALLQMNIAKGEIDYNVAAQNGMATSWKDEFLVVWFTTMVSLHFVPYKPLQEALAQGWVSLNTLAPDWFGYCFVGMVVATFGLKGWKIFKNGGANA